MPDLDKLSSEWGFGGSPSGGTTSSSGGSGTAGGASGHGATAGNAGAGDAGAPVGSGGTTSDGGTTSGGGKTNAGGKAGITGGISGLAGAGGTYGGSSGEGGGGEGGAVECAPGFASCPGSAECATELAVGNPSANTVTDCGACGVTCSVVNASGAVCAAGTCTPSCSGGFASCNAVTANDGCEVDLKTPSNCGACGRTCSTVGSSAVHCTNSLCAPTCAPAYADCSADDGSHPDDGCETYLDGLMRCAITCSEFEACGKTQVCNAGSCMEPQGVVMFSVPLSATTDNQRYADRFTPRRNLTNSTMTLRLYAPGATGGSINIYLSDNDFSSGPGGIVVGLSSLSQGWTDVNISTGGVSGTFDPSEISQVNLEVIGVGGGPYTSPTVIYVDSIRTSNLAVNDRFDANLVDMVKSMSQMVAGSTITWLDVIP